MASNPSLPRRVTVATVLLSVAIMAIVLVSSGSHVGRPASASGGGPELALSVTSGADSCSAGACDVRTTTSFILSVDVATSPAAGYVLFQSFLDFGVFDPTANEDGAGPNTCSDGIENGGSDGFDRFDDDCVSVGLVYKPATQAADEVFWPDLVSGGAFRLEPGPGLLFHGGLSGLTPPPFVSTFEGSVVQVLMTCPASEITSTIQLLQDGDPIALQNGALFVEPNTTQSVPKVGSLTINCLNLPTPTPTPTATPTATATATPTPTATPDPTDTDGDGCSDVRENGPDETLGGLRDPLNPWDFYDVLGPGAQFPKDRIIDLPNDILAVILHFAPLGLPPYDANFDRGVSSGPNVWNMTAPDGVIDLPNDILGVILQFDHDCR